MAKLKSMRGGDFAASFGPIGGRSKGTSFKADRKQSVRDSYEKESRGSGRRVSDLVSGSPSIQPRKFSIAKRPSSPVRDALDEQRLEAFERKLA